MTRALQTTIIIRSAIAFYFIAHHCLLLVVHYSINFQLIIANIDFVMGQDWMLALNNERAVNSFL